jgi:hypothetical protein
MQELVDSIVRFSTAMSLFGVQQLQNVVEVATNSDATVKKVQQSFDAVTSVVLNQLDPGKRPTIDSITNLVDKTYSTLNVPALDPAKMAQKATDAVRKSVRARKWPIFAAATLSLALASGTAVWLRPWESKIEPASVARMALPLPDKPSIAVLPFANLSGDPEQEYFSDGLAVDIITALSRSRCAVRYRSKFELHV